MKYVLSIEIESPLARVVELFDDPANWPQWREGFVRFETLMGEAWEEGAKLLLVNRVGGREVQMTETVEVKRLPEEMSCVYEAPGNWAGAWNRVRYRFHEAGPDRTGWEFDSEFRCRGLLKVVAWLMPGMFRRTSLREMKNFKHFVESRRDG